MQRILKVATSWDEVKQIICRHRELHNLYVETYHKRHPDKMQPPPKLIIPYLAQA